MTDWKRRSTSADVYTTVEVDLDEFSDEQLLQELIDRGILTEGGAVALLNRPAGNAQPAASAGGYPDLTRARDELAIGRRHEALIYVERYLGRDWIGRLTQ
ncbi:hypothetical protein [Phreatobacter oligotrophus]|uniref:Uncharacterized protein n=1 Tax=Phreatobacter oligotrophus TaxID=1122261 RepID=A0A2T4ZIR1_9HYPH|nr:hypothetical protein [Phreatobacter oligotrophus]PTM61868.1 hypothetical protein C8P69_101540 [Phreatobacter oligotrophus]